MHLPLAEEPSADDAPVDAPRVAGANPGVLVVDDEQIVRELAANILELEGFEVLSAANGVGALELLSRTAEGIDVLVTDVSMPGMGGRELAAKIGEILPGIPVVFMSGYSDEILGATADEGTPLTFLAKPFSPRTLVRAVRAAVAWEPTAEPAAEPASEAMEQLAVAVTCVVADDHPAVLDSVSRYLRRQGIDVVALAARGDEALRAIEELRPTVAVLDIAMEPVGGIEIARQLAQTQPETHSILYTGTPIASTSPRPWTPGRAVSSSRSRRWPTCSGRSPSSPRDGAMSTPVSPPRSRRARASPRCRL